MANEWYQGVYVVKNKEKYIGNKNPEYRSSYENRLCHYMDYSKSVRRWGYEILEIPYSYDLDRSRKKRNYVLDFYAEIVDKNGKLNKYVIEVKPKKQLNRPDPPKNKNKKRIKRYIYEMKMYIKNQNKWKYAKAWCRRNGMIFKIITEKELNIL